MAILQIDMLQRLGEPTGQYSSHRIPWPGCLRLRASVFDACAHFTEGGWAGPTAAVERAPYFFHPSSSGWVGELLLRPSTEHIPIVRGAGAGGLPTHPRSLLSFDGNVQHRPLAVDQEEGQILGFDRLHEPL